MPRILLSLIAAASTVAALGAWQAGDTGRPTVPPTSAGTAILAGRVVSDLSDAGPVRRATVHLVGAGGTAVTPRLVGTDDDGRFMFDRLPAGSYTLSVTKPGYVQSFFGSRLPGRGPGVPIAIPDKQRIDITVRIVPGAAISGVVTDERGNAAPGIMVRAIAVGSAGAAGSSSPAVTTDDRGAYRIFGIAPGEYVVAASTRLIGNLLVAGTTDAEVRWALSAAASGGIVSAPGGAAAMPSPGRPVRYAAVLYPGTTDVGRLVTLSVGIGEERSGIDIPLRLVPAATVAGTVVDSYGPAAASTVMLYPRRGDRSGVIQALVSSGMLAVVRATVSAGRFSIASVAPGDYTIVARSGSGLRGAAPPAGTTLVSVTPISVDGADRTDLVLNLFPGLTLTGSLTFEPSPAAPPDDLGALTVSLSPLDPYQSAAPPPRAAAQRDGTFRLTGIVPGSYTLQVTVPPDETWANWALKAAALKGRDVADGAFELQPGDDLESLRVRFTDRVASVFGRLTDRGGEPVTRYAIVVFTVDRSLWQTGARRIRAVRPATDGSFAITGLPPGQYTLAAAEDVDAADLVDPVFLSALLGAAYRFDLAEGEKKRQDLAVASRLARFSAKQTASARGMVDRHAFGVGWDKGIGAWHACPSGATPAQAFGAPGAVCGR